MALAALLVLSTFSMVGVGAASASTGNTTDTTFHVSQNGQCYSVSALGDGTKTVEDFYDYRNPSNSEEHNYTYSSLGTTHLQENQNSSIFVYHGSEGYSLVLVHDQLDVDDQDAPYGSTITFEFSNMGDGEWAVRDDNYTDSNGDLQDDNWDTAGNNHVIDWMWAEHRTDGGAYRGIADEQITIDPAFNEQATAWDSWDYSGDDANMTEAWNLLGNDSRQELSMTDSITLAQGDCSDDSGPSTGPTADFSVSNSTVANDETVAFDASNSSDDGTIESYEWDFGDGNTSSGETTSHSYSSPGEYEVRLTVTDDQGNSDTASANVTVSESSEGPIEYTNASTAVVTGEFEKIWVETVWYENDGIATATYTLDNVSGTTTVTADEEGVNGSAIYSVAADENTTTAQVEHYKENPYDYEDEIKPYSLELSVADVTETDDGTYDVTFDYVNPNDVALHVEDSQFTTGNVANDAPLLFDAGENSFTTTWKPAGNDERVTLEVNQSNFGLKNVSASTQSASEYDGSPTAQIESGDWAYKNSGAHFDGSNSTDDGEIVSYEWEFSDGGNATGEEVDHFYNSTGEHTATLTVTDSDGNTDSETVSIEIREEDVTKPDASVTASPKTVEKGETITFDGSNSSDESGIAKYHWDFDGDNEFERTTDGPTTTYTFSEPGEYEVVMGAEDDGDNRLIGTDTVNVTVEESSSGTPTDGKPTAKLSLTKQTADFDQKIGYNASASTDDGEVVEYRWDFDGDGDVDRTTPDNATGKNNPAHTVWHEVYKLHDETGTYTATVTVVDDDGHTDTANAEVTITEDATPPNATLDVPSEVTVDETFTVEATDFTEDDLKHVCWKIDGHDKPDGATATHTFEETGEYDVTLRIVDQNGNANLLERTITVTAADDGSDGSNGDEPSDGPSDDPPEDGLDDEPNEGNTGGGVPAADPPEDDSNDESNGNNESNESDDQTPDEAALDDTEDTSGEIILQSDATDATVEATESVPDDARQATAALDGFEALSYATVSGAEDFDATFTVSKDRLESAAAAPEDVTLFRFEDGSWNAVETEQLNETDDAFRFGANATNGTYAVGIDVPSTEIEDLRVASNRVAPGDAVTVTVTVANDGQASGTQDVALTVDGETVATKSVSVEADSTAEVEFAHSFDAPGVYAVSAGDANAEVVVEGIETTASNDDTETATTTATETASTDGPGVPGFGVGAALVALAAAALLARRQA